jgi:hypothetical protein
LFTRALSLRKIVESDSINAKARAWSEDLTEHLETQRNLLQDSIPCIQQDTPYYEAKGILKCKKDKKSRKKKKELFVLTVD